MKCSGTVCILLEQSRKGDEHSKYVVNCDCHHCHPILVKCAGFNKANILLSNVHPLLENKHEWSLTKQACCIYLSIFSRAKRKSFTKQQTCWKVYVYTIFFFGSRTCIARKLKADREVYFPEGARCHFVSLSMLVQSKAWFKSHGVRL